MELDDGDDEGREDEPPLFAWLPPEDRLWRHPSEIDDGPTLPGPGAGPGRPLRTVTMIRPVARVWSVALFAGLAGAIIASSFFMATGLTDRHTTVVEPVVTPGTVALAGASNPDGVGDWPLIASAVASSVVGVRVEDDSNLQIGSGVLYAAADNESYILTAQDLVSNGGTVTVTFSNGGTQAARIVGTDAVSGIAVLSTAGSNRNFPPFGSVSNVQVAEEVLALGTRLSSSRPAVTDTVSGLDQSVTTDADDSATMAGMLALSGSPAPETSDGGALVDPDGAVIGINTDIASTDPAAQGVTYAVPIDIAEHVAEQLLKGEAPTHPWLGIEDATDLSTTAARQLGVAGGAQVGVVDRGGPAAAAGLRDNDIVTAFDGHAVDSSGALVTLLAQTQPGHRTTLTFFHQNRWWTAFVTVAEQGPNSAQAG